MGHETPWLRQLGPTILLQVPLAFQDYAILSGGNILGLKEEAVPELRRVFAWARRLGC